MCYNISGDIMFESMENLKITSTMKGLSKSPTAIVKRKTHAFFFRTNGMGMYTIDGKNYTTKKNEVFFLPEGCSYEFIKKGDEECRYLSINFHADIKNPKPAVYSLENFSETEYLCTHFCDLWKFGSQSDKYKCLSLFYNLIAFISNTENTNYSQKRKFEIISPAVNYLKAHIFDFTLKADSLHLMCGISDTYFRKIFISKFGVSPQKYITSKRISQAKSIIENYDYTTISEVASLVGYSDPLYFSRAFKKKYGIAPTEVNKD